MPTKLEDPKGGEVRPFMTAVVMSAIFAAITSPALAQEAAPTPTPTPSPNPVPEQASQQQACPSGGSSLQQQVSQRFSVGKLKANMTVTLKNGLMSVQVTVKGRLPRAVKKLTLSGKLKHRGLSTSKFTLFKKFSGRDKASVGKKKVFWTFKKSWCAPSASRTEVWQVELRARLLAVRMKGSNNVLKSFPVVPSAPSS